MPDRPTPIGFDGDIQQRRSDATDRLERLLGRLLSAGISISAIVLAFGLVLWVVLGPESVGLVVLHAGLLTLMATPLLRVLVSFVEYVRERDWFFVATTLAVLMILAGSLLVAIRSA